MRFLGTGIALAVTACATPVAPAPWESRLQGNAIVLLGEVHDNALHHRLRLDVLRRALEAGWRPAIAMEQFDREHQPDIDGARRERPRDAQYLIERAAPGQRGWNWDFYRPLVALALEYELPLLAANLSNVQAAQVVRAGTGAVFDAAGSAKLGLDRAIDAGWQAAQEHEIDAGHCGALPPAMWRTMARAQFARDALMAATLAGNATQGAVLLAGNGHVRRDIGVPRWLDPSDLARSFVVGFLEDANAPAGAQPDRFDATVLTPDVTRPDPCARFVPSRR